MLAKIKEHLQNKAIDWMTRDLLKVIRADRVFTIRKTLQGNKIVYRGEIMQPDFQIKLQEEANGFINSALWKIVKNKLRWTIYQEMFHNSKSDSDMRGGKFALYSLQQLEDIFKNIANL